MENRAIIRMKNNISFAGQMQENEYNQKPGVLIKPSDESEMIIWIPEQEINCVFLPNGDVRKY